MLWAKGYAGSSFLSFTIALNIALAKWEPFRKSLVDTATQLNEIYSKHVAISANSSILADDVYAERIQTAKQICKDYAHSIQIRNERIWRFCRGVAIASSYAAAVALFFQLSLGITALALLFGPMLVSLSTFLSKKDIRTKIRLKFDDLMETIKEEQKTSSVENADKIDRTIPG
jgi:hypothetical protein